MGRTFLGVRGSDWYRVITRLPLEPKAQNPHTHSIIGNTDSPSSTPSTYMNLRISVQRGVNWLNHETSPPSPTSKPHSSVPLSSLPCPLTRSTIPPPSGGYFFTLTCLSLPPPLTNNAKAYPSTALSATALTLHFAATSPSFSIQRLTSSPPRPLY